MSEPPTPRLETTIRSVLAPLLREDGFSGAGRTFRRVNDGWVQVVSVQGSKYGHAFAINLAIHPLALPDVCGNELEPKKITAELCELRRRLSEAQGDQWWEYESTPESMALAMAAAAEVYRKSGRQLFERVSGPKAPIKTVTAAAFSAGSYDFAGFGSTPVRMALTFSLLRQSEGCTEESKAFAAYGLQYVGGAVSLRPALERLAAQPSP